MKTDIFYEIDLHLNDLGISLAAHSKLYKDANEEQLNRLLEGDFLELQFSQGKPFNYFRQKNSKKGIAK